MKVNSCFPFQIWRKIYPLIQSLGVCVGGGEGGGEMIKSE